MSKQHTFAESVKSFALSKTLFILNKTDFGQQLCLPQKIFIKLNDIIRAQFQKAVKQEKKKCLASLYAE